MELTMPQYSGALIVVDMVYDFVNSKGSVYYESNKQILKNINRLIPEARKNNLLIIFIQHSHRIGKYDPATLVGRKNCLEGTGGDELDPSLSIDKEKDYVLKKRRYSAFAHTDLDLILREHGIQDVVICGTKTNNCIRSTVEDAYHLEYNVYVISDCVGTDNKEVNDVYLFDINRYYGTVVDSKHIFKHVGAEKCE